jgi:hypothetical protein
MRSRDLPTTGLAYSRRAHDDTLFPSAALLPMSDLRGGHRPLATTPGVLRPLTAILGVAPIVSGKHETTSTRWTEHDATEVTDDGKVTKDSVPIVRTDT